jgi:hypothetical protein
LSVELPPGQLTVTVSSPLKLLPLTCTVWLAEFAVGDPGLMS